MTTQNLSKFHGTNAAQEIKNLIAAVTGVEVTVNADNDLPAWPTITTFSFSGKVDGVFAADFFMTDGAVSVGEELVSIDRHLPGEAPAQKKLWAVRMKSGELLYLAFSEKSISEPGLSRPVEGSIYAISGEGKEIAASFERFLLENAVIDGLNSTKESLKMAATQLRILLKFLPADFVMPHQEALVDMVHQALYQDEAH